MEESSDLLEEIMDEVCKSSSERKQPNFSSAQNTRQRFEEEEDEVDNYKVKSYQPRNLHNYSSDGENFPYHDIFSDGMSICHLYLSVSMFVCTFVLPCKYSRIYSL
ncbi:hypothetical protein LOTGIDRAFT_173851 [Lottia gigantea]|uniref:Uncharacterized protein n=1 Tax=Lottia gigantea TaxID=225164 RepID=V4A5F6_LOTGI|nr:hypothetical protein LOTGIDRAFT_173851 [Lottia gigantea]ESO99158.1 hypothetical protein LOTGIDRAFT_173851 [Lottia gigantea]